MSRMRRSALLVTSVIAVALPAATGLTPPAAQGAPGGTTCGTSSRIEGDFRSVSKPPSLSGPLVAHAVEPADPRTVYLADPTTVVVSNDSGCTRNEVLTVPSAPETSIRSLSVPDTGVPTGRLLVVVGTEPAGTPGLAGTSTVWSRTSAGGPFRQSAPLPGRVAPAIAPGDPDVVYLATTDEASISLAPLRSRDGGATFTPARGVRTFPTPGGPELDAAPRTAATDPGASGVVLVGSASLQRSTDGGDSWQTVLGATDVGYSHALAVHPAGAAAGQAVVVGTSQSNTPLDDPSATLWSVPPNGGAPQALPTGAPLAGVPQSLALGRTTDEVVLTSAGLPPHISDGYSGPGTLLLLDSVADTWVDVADGRGQPLLDAVVDRTADPAVHLHSSSLSEPRGRDEYVVYSPPAVGSVVPPTVDDGTGTGSGPPAAPGFPPAPAACPDSRPFEAPAVRAGDATLTPTDAAVVPDPGGRATHQAVLDLPGDTSALDLHLLLDVSDSMGPAAAGVVCGLEELVTGLADDGVDVRVGLSTFHDAGPGQRYRREVDLAPPGRPLQRTLRSVEPMGGEETHRTALLQTVTGSGLTVDGTELVEPGQGATFREDALKVVLHLTDEPWTATTPGEPSPFAVVEALRAADVRHVGIQVVSEDPVLTAGGDRGAGTVDGPLLRTQLDQFSVGSGALAPAGGVDCDGDGSADLREDDPLVCVGVSRGGVVPLGAAVRALVDALDVRGSVELATEAPEGVDVVVGARYDDVALREPGRYAFPLSLRCPNGDPGPQPVSLVAWAGSVPVAEAAVRLRCSSVAVPAPAPVPSADEAPGPDIEALPLAGAPESSAAAAAPPAPPPPPVPVPAPAPG
ncbi:vWA domain-containing protein, partial [Nocardioides sp.]|uniref:vWA domain-containing protein n=1 Tax=Nocardioides sp. TaxID=35761 RepID=UPI002B26F48B